MHDPWPHVLLSLPFSFFLPWEMWRSDRSLQSRWVKEPRKWVQRGLEQKVQTIITQSKYVLEQLKTVAMTLKWQIKFYVSSVYSSIYINATFECFMAVNVYEHFTQNLLRIQDVNKNAILIFERKMHVLLPVHFKIEGGMTTSVNSQNLSNNG